MGIYHIRRVKSPIMSAVRLSNVKAIIAALPLIAVAAAFFAFADSVGPVAGFLAPVAVLLALIVFFYVSGSRRQ